ncbi:3-dehydroquinate synthase [Nafulsella turpanensis]|uniref:3-dehydroquinate synthase n=1 Tax=Nafulsella turpanensis TaxID=1265690 RepID=UPI000348B390|nr:3-dehydroquinate synthase [Nafulsella turpanensis]
MNLPSSIHTHLPAPEALQKLLLELDFSQLAVLTDEHTSRHCLPKIKRALPESFTSIEIQSGEENKNLQSCSHIWEALTSTGFDRKGILINLGGGVLTDMGGFCAATYKRGIRFINIPTTLLSQVDASVGGKLGIDFMGFKNHIGLFQEAEAVLIDADFLSTLPLQELRSGYAEVVKHALIADAHHWQQLQEKDWQQQDWQQIIRHSIGLKQQITLADPREKGLRKILNFGHTIGHAVESYFLENGPKLLHGEAVAIGMVAEAYLSYLKTGLSAEELQNCCSYISEIFPLASIPESAFEQLISLALQDKKNERGIIHCTLLSQVGKAVYDVAISRKDIEEAFQWYNKKGWIN